MPRSVSRFFLLAFLFLFPCWMLQSQVPEVTGAGDSGPGSLRAVIDAATDGDTITFSPSLNGTPIELTSGEIEIDKDLVLLGNDTSQTIINGSGLSRIFHITNAEVVIKGMKCIDGASAESGGAIRADSAHVDITSSSFIENASGLRGGAIHVEGGSMTIANSSFRGNTTVGNSPGDGGAAISSSGSLEIHNTGFNENTANASYGGALLNLPGGSLDMMNSSVTENTAFFAGGGLSDYSGTGTTVTLNDVTIEHNATTDPGGIAGGIQVAGTGDIVLHGGSIAGNTASVEGGGIWIGSGSTILEGTSVQGNMAAGTDGKGGGIYTGGDLNLSGSMVLSNTASVVGGGIWSGAGDLRVSNSSVDSNAAGGNEAGMGGGIYKEGGLLKLYNVSMIRYNNALGAQSMGGGVYVAEGAELEISSAMLIGNSAVRAGGGLADLSGPALQTMIMDGIFEHNAATAEHGLGGGLYIAGGGSAGLTAGVYSGNQAGRAGGAIWSGSGDLSFSGSSIRGNTAGGIASGFGGGVYKDSGSLRMEHHTVVNGNSAAGAHSFGGGIYVDEGVELFLDESTVHTNTAVSGGGGIADYSDTAAVSVFVALTLSNNTATSDSSAGGGLYVAGSGDLEIFSGSIFDNESGARGGGIYSEAGDVLLSEVPLSGNACTGNGSGNGGGGLYNHSGEVFLMGSTLAGNTVSGMGGRGGGLFNAESGTATVVRSTISGNASSGNGGGLFNAGTGTITASTLAQNSAAAAGGGLYQGSVDSLASDSAHITLRSSLVAENSASATGRDVSSDGGMIFSGGYNLIGQDDANAFDAQATDLEGTATDPIASHIHPLENNGGPTRTHAIDCESPAINTGDPSLDAPDQREEEVFAGRRDIGAYEYQDSCEATAGSDLQNALKFSSIFPNPLREGVLTLEVPSVQDGAIKIGIFNLATNKIVFQKTTTTSHPRLRIGHIPNGTYLVRIRHKDAEARHKLIVLR